MTETPQRSDFLASFCLVQEGGVAEEFSKIVELATRMQSQLQYWEIVYVVGERMRHSVDALGSQISAIKNLRIIIVNNAVGSYRRRVVCASEAIGDVVVVSSFEDLDYLDLCDLASKAYKQDEIIMGRSARRRTALPLFHLTLAAMSSYKVNSHDMKTVALPRARLENILARPTATLDLRFEPKAAGRNYQREICDTTRGHFHSARFSERFALATELVASSAPRFLKGFAALSMCVLVGAIAYGIYVVGALIFLETLQEGWFSTNFVQAGAVAFIALGLAILSLGLAEIYETMNGREKWTITDEIANITYFDQASDFNVEHRTGHRLNE